MKPKVFINNIDKDIGNNKESFHYIGKDNNDEEFHFNPDIDMIDISDDYNVRNEINKIFLSTSFVYKSKVNIILKNNERYTEDIIAVKDNNLITIDNKKIPINDILKIEKV